MVENMSGRNDRGLTGLAEKETSKEVSKDKMFKLFLICALGAAISAVFLCYYLFNLGITTEKLIKFFINDVPIVIYVCFILYMSFYGFAYFFLNKWLRGIEIKDRIINLFLFSIILTILYIIGTIFFLLLIKIIL